MNSRYDFVLDTEKRIRNSEVVWEGLKKSLCDWCMWLELSKFNIEKTELRLQAISGSDPRLFEVRRRVEMAHGITDSEKLNMLAANYFRKEKALGGQWFIASVGKETVGEIGFIPFDYYGKKVARLQDVDILPNFQGKGLGRLFLSECVCYLKERNFDAVCLMAASDDWPKDWYARFGFEKLDQM